MNVLIVGRGGREHTLVWKLSQSPLINKIFVAPGNDGMRELAVLKPIQETDFKSLTELAESENIDLTIVGPEIPLAKGIVDYFNKKELNIFGPTAAAARIEGSKIFAKELMNKYQIPTADFYVAKTKKDAHLYLEKTADGPIVVKADGLAAGKGVYVCNSKSQAWEAVNDMMDQELFGQAGSQIIFEELMIGEEASVFVLTDGKDYVVLPPAQDHKRAYDNDKGKNTGGMGAYAPAPIVSDPMLEQIENEIIRPTIIAMANEGSPFKGCLYAGLMLTESGPRVVEFNCRFGDPEIQVVLPLVQEDILPIIREIAEGKLEHKKLKKSKESAICVVLASGGYPDAYEKNKKISGLAQASKIGKNIIFHAGTKLLGNEFVTNGGRVLNVVNLENDLNSAYESVYKSVSCIKFENMHYRLDIGYKAIKR